MSDTRAPQQPASPAERARAVGAIEAAIGYAEEIMRQPGMEQARHRWTSYYAPRLRELLAAPAAQQPAEPLTDAQIAKGARVISDRIASACGMNKDDHWKEYGHLCIEDFKSAAFAALAHPPAADTGLREAAERVQHELSICAEENPHDQFTRDLALLVHHVLAKGKQ